MIEDPLAGARRKAEIEREIERYRSNLSSVAADKLINMFMPYLLKWVGFLTSHSGCLMEGPFFHFLQNPRFRRIPGDLVSRHRLIVDSLRPCEKDDLFSEVCLSFLEACLRSENLVYGVPHFLAPRVYDLIKDPTVFAGRCHSLESSDETEMEMGVLHSTTARPRGLGDEQIYEKELRSRALEVSLGDCSFKDLVTVSRDEDGLLRVDISQDWVDGRTTGLGGFDSFTDLLPNEREILVRFYVGRQQHVDIARDMAITHRQSRSLLSRARTKLAASLSHDTN